MKGDRFPVAAWCSMVLGALILFFGQSPPGMSELVPAIVGAVFFVVGVICATVRGA